MTAAASPYAVNDSLIAAIVGVTVYPQGAAYAENASFSFNWWIDKGRPLRIDVLLPGVVAKQKVMDLALKRLGGGSVPGNSQMEE